MTMLKKTRTAALVALALVSTAALAKVSPQDAAKLGVPQTYLYELLDPWADATGDNMQRHFGLFDINNKPKIAATALHNLTTILADDGKVAWHPDAVASIHDRLRRTP